MDDFERELKLGFLDEAEQSITDVEQSFLSLESDPNNKENINNIFRLAHNLKGSSKAVGFDQLGQFTHEFETFVLRVKDGELKITGAVVSLLLKTTDSIKEMILKLRINLNADLPSGIILEEMKNFTQVSAHLRELKSELQLQQVNLQPPPAVAFLCHLAHSLE